MLTTNYLSVPEVACHVEQAHEGFTLLAYAVRQPGAQLWSGLAAFRTDKTVLLRVNVDAIYPEPERAVEDAVDALQARPEPDSCEVDTTWRILEGGKA